MFDSFVIGWALGGSAGTTCATSAPLPWNTPERVHFASTWWKRVLAYLYKCVPVTRGSDRTEVALVLEKVRFLLARGEVALVFPEGGRSRSGRVDVEAAAYGVGPHRERAAGLPRAVRLPARRGAGRLLRPAARGERFRVSVACIEPKSDRSGLRGSLEVARQITARLAEMERSHFDGR